MELKEALLKRRSVRKFLDKKVEKEIVQELMEAAMAGPSAKNKRPWRFYVVTDPEVLEQFLFQLSYLRIFLRFFFLIMLL